MSDVTILMVAEPHPDGSGISRVRPFQGGDCDCSQVMIPCDCWVAKNKSPIDGTAFQACTWHSGKRQDIESKNPLDLIDIRNPPNYGYWDSTYTCYDDCWKQSEMMADINASRLRVLGRMIDEMNNTGHHIETIMQGVIALEKTQADLITQLGQINADISYYSKPIPKNPRQQILENIVSNAEKAMSKWEKQADTLWQRQLQTGKVADQSEDAKLRYFRGISNYADAKTKLQRAKEQLAHWHNANPPVDPAIAIASLKKSAIKINADLKQVSIELPQAANAAFYDVYSTLEEYKEIPMSGSPYYKHLEDGLQKMREITPYYESQLLLLSKYIPKERHQKLAVEHLKKRQIADRVYRQAASETKKAKVLNVTGNSVLGQLYIKSDGKQAREFEVYRTPKVIIQTAMPSKEGLPIPQMMDERTERDNWRSR